MFGKGVYFADVVSKSANYCFTNSQNASGLLVLSEVALGEMHECKKAEFITRLPKGKSSTKGLGRWIPDPGSARVNVDGVEIPLGRVVDSGVKDTALLYNE